MSTPLRIRLARWLAPEWEQESEMERERRATSLANYIRSAERDVAARNALRQIASRETPNASHTVKKMARIAKEALG